MPYTSPHGVGSAASTMSVPEHVRYRESTMFVGTSPFGYKGTDDRTSPFWHPPATPPHEIRHRMMSCPSVPRATASNKSPTPAISHSPKATEQKAPESTTTDVASVLFSSPKIGHHLVQHTNGASDMGRLGITDLRQEVESCEISGTRRDSMIGMIISECRYEAVLMCFDTENTPTTGTSCLPSIPELMVDDRYDHDSCASTLRISLRHSSGKGSPHIHKFLRCPRCDQVLKWVSVDRLVEGVLQTYRLQAECNCESTLESTKMYKPHGQESEVVQVNRGAW
jgi:hypothetical protein